MPLDVLRRVVAPAYFGSDWDGVVASMLASPADVEVVSHLRSALLSGRGFSSPVVVLPDDEGDRPFSLANGMHRVVASLLEGVDDVLVTDAYPEVGNPESFEVVFTASFSPGTPPDRDPFDVVVEVLRSFPLGETWVESVSFSSSYGVVSGTWDCPWELEDAFRSELLERSSRWGLALEVSSFERYSWDDEDLDP